jgi:hypothetical protein
MSRHLYSIYNPSNYKRQIRETTRLFKLNQIVDYSNTLTSDIALDLVLSIQNDIKILPLLTPSKLFLDYLQTTYTDWLAWRYNSCFQEYYTTIQEHQTNYSNDSDYPIYVKSIIAKENLAKHSSHLENSLIILKTILNYYDISFNQDRFDSIKNGAILVIFADEI